MSVSELARASNGLYLMLMAFAVHSFSIQPPGKPFLCRPPSFFATPRVHPRGHSLQSSVLSFCQSVSSCKMKIGHINYRWIYVT